MIIKEYNSKTYHLKIKILTSFNYTQYKVDDAICNVHCNIKLI